MIKGNMRRVLIASVGGAAVAMVAACGQAAPPADGPEPEEVAVGYGTVEKEEVTGAIRSISAREVAQERVGNIEELLKGRVSGVHVKQVSGGISVRIRGTSSLTGTGEPLFIVDGMPVQQRSGRVLMISPYDIERIEVLKDVSSTSIYGSRGANGVIVITTKERG